MKRALSALLLLTATLGGTTRAASDIVADLSARSSSSAKEPIFHTGTYNPFTRIFGRPEFFAGSIQPAGTWDIRGVVTLTSHTEPAGNGFEQLELDGETTRLALTFTRGLGDDWEIGATIPLLHASGGFLDATVEDWHDIIGASNAQRNVRARNQLNFIYQRGGDVRIRIEDSSTGVGDIALFARYQLLAADDDSRKLTLHGGLKLPTGSYQHLRGSGAADYSLGIGYTDTASLKRANLTVSAHAGVLLLGDGKVLSELQKRTVPIGGIQIGLALGNRVDLLAQLQAAGSYYDSSLATLGDNTVQLSVGANVRFPGSGWNLTLGIVEDAFSDIMPDFALYSALSRSF
ncbi:MAG: DUF3187 family protein [Pseudomonadales bacterium]